MAKAKSLKRKKLMSCDMATQTEERNGWLQPAVVLEKLCESEIRRITMLNSRRKENTEISDQVSIQNRCNISIPKRPSSIFKPPGNYRIFVKPITNNEVANSTLVSEIDDNKQDTPTRPGKRVRFVKPGPLSYKQRVLQEINDDMEDMNVPVMLSENSQINVERRNSLNLETILEQINENSTATPELDNLNFDINNSNLEPQSIVVQAEISNASGVNTENDGFVLDNKEADKNSQESQPKTIRMEFKGITTTITSLSTSGNLEDSSDTGASDDEPQDVTKDTKYVNIKAHTVHIHNHFYYSH